MIQATRSSGHTVASSTKGSRPRPLRAKRNDFVESFSLSGEFHREIDRGNHAVGPREVFPCDLESGAVIGARSGKGKPEGDVHAFVKRVEFQRDESLIVIHAE